MLAMSTMVAMARAALLAVVTVFVMAASAAHSLPSTVALPAGEDCSNVATIMLDCLSYVTNGSETPQPTKSCCGGVAAVVKGSPGCICDALKQARDLGIAINISRVVELPAACSVKAPDVHCGAPSPGASPTPAPSSPPPPPPPPSAAPSQPPHSSPPPSASPPPQSSPSPKPAPPPPPPPPLHSAPAPTTTSPPQASPNPPSKQPSPGPPPPPSPTQEPPPVVTPPPQDSPPAVAQPPAEAPAEPNSSAARRLVSTLLLVLAGVAACFHL